MWPQAAYDTFDYHGKVLHHHVFLATHPETVEFVLKSSSEAFSLGALQKRMLEPALGAGLILAEGNDWAQIRRVTSRFMKRSEPEVVSQASWKAGQKAARQLGEVPTLQLNGKAEQVLGDAFLELFARLFFDSTPEDEEGVADAVDQYLKSSQRVDLATFLDAPLWLSPRRKKDRILAHKLDERFESALRVRGLDNLQPTRAKRRDFVVNLMTGYKTASIAALWFLVTLSRSNTDLKKVKVEAQRWNRSPGLDELEGATFFDAAFAESNRLFPALPLLLRSPKEDIVLPRGQRLKRNALVFIAPWIIHRHSKLWPKPDMFIPERMILGHPTAVDLVPKDTNYPLRPPYYLPYGWGPRQCPGANIASLALKAFLLGMLNLGQPKLHDGDTCPNGSFMLRPPADLKLSWDLSPSEISNVQRAS